MLFQSGTKWLTLTSCIVMLHKLSQNFVEINNNFRLGEVASHAREHPNITMIDIETNCFNYAFTLTQMGHNLNELNYRST